MHAPDDWNVLWRPVIEVVKVNHEFRECHREYCERYERSSHRSGRSANLHGRHKRYSRHFGPVRFRGHLPRNSSVPSCVNDPKKLRGGFMIMSLTME